MFFNQSISPAVILASLPSTGLDWEKTYQTDIGLEIDLRTIDILLKLIIIISKPRIFFWRNHYLVLQVILDENIGQVENKGFEFTFIL